MLPAESVQCEEDLNTICVGFAVVRDGDFYGEASLELDGNALGLLGCLLRSGGELPHVVGGRGVGVFEDAGLIGNVEEIFVGRPGLGGGLGNRDVLLSSVGEESLATREAVVEF